MWIRRSPPHIRACRFPDNDQSRSAGAHPRDALHRPSTRMVHRQTTLQRDRRSCGKGYQCNLASVGFALDVPNVLCVRVVATQLTHDFFSAISLDEVQANLDQDPTSDEGGHNLPKLKPSRFRRVHPWKLSRSSTKPQWSRGTLLAYTRMPQADIWAAGYPNPNNLKQEPAMPTLFIVCDLAALARWIVLAILVLR